MIIMIYFFRRAGLYSGTGLDLLVIVENIEDADEECSLEKEKMKMCVCVWIIEIETMIILYFPTAIEYT